MKKPKRPYRFGIIFYCLPFHQLVLHNLVGIYIKQTGFDYGMIVGTVSVIYAAYLMYEKKLER